MHMPILQTIYITILISKTMLVCWMCIPIFSESCDVLTPYTECDGDEGDLPIPTQTNTKLCTVTGEISGTIRCL